jgi:endonuclease/exonuclease/phosphatase family metal-dependent hydrolase
MIKLFVPKLIYKFLLFAIAVAFSSSCASPNLPDQIRIGTFNVENFDGLDAAKLEAISQIVSRNFDAIGLQEISAIAAEKLQSKLNQESGTWAYILGETGNKQRLALFYRTDLLEAQKVGEWRDVNVTGTLRSPLVTSLKTKGSGWDTTLVIVHQKGGFGRDADRLRQVQSDRLRQAVDAYQANPQADPDLVILGDFNSPSWAEQNRGLRDAPLTFLTKPIETGAEANCLKKRGQPKFPDGRFRFSNRGTGCVIDHIAVSQLPKGAEEEYIAQTIQILAPQQDLGFANDKQFFADVSDHLPVRAVFRVR